MPRISSITIFSTPRQLLVSCAADYASRYFLRLAAFDGAFTAAYAVSASIFSVSSMPLLSVFTHLRRADKDIFFSFYWLILPFIDV
jgi:hypothetical protein